jgi:hypothetical protein
MSIEHTESTKIDWKKDKKITHEIIEKKQKNKKTKESKQ